MSNRFPVTHFFTLLRHGKSQANEQNVLQGQMDFPLSTEGIQQSRRLGEYWANQSVTFDKIISSPLCRALETARIISEFLSAPIEVDDQWKERKFGNAEGLVYEEITSTYTELPFRSIYEPAYETGESDWDLYIRAASAVQRLIHHPPARYLVVSHGAILNSVLSAIIGITPKPPNHRIRFGFINTGYAQLEYKAGIQNWTIRSLNNTYHLCDQEHLGDMNVY